MSRCALQLAAGFATINLCACGVSTPATVTATAYLPHAADTTPAATVSVATTRPVTAPAAAATPGLSPSPALTAPVAPVARELTSGGCCAQPFWSADSRQVRYIDRPSSGQPSGIWAVSLTGGPASFVSARLGIFSPDETLVAYPESGQTFIERLGGAHWKIDNGGRAVNFSPDSTSVAWQVASSAFNFDSRRVEIWVAAVDGSGAHKVAALVGGGLAGWFPDGQRLLVTSRDGDQSLVQTLKLADGSLSRITEGARLQGVALSPRGGWVDYAVAFSGDSGQDGLWVVPTTGGPAQRLEVFGGFAWRAEGRLLIVPLEASASSNRLIEIAAEGGAQRELTDPVATPFNIAAGNWAVSPDGLHLAFVSTVDHNIWVLDLPE